MVLFSAGIALQEDGLKRYSQFVDDYRLMDTVEKQLASQELNSYEFRQAHERTRKKISLGFENNVSVRLLKSGEVEIFRDEAEQMKVAARPEIERELKQKIDRKPLERPQERD